MMMTSKEEYKRGEKAYRELTKDTFPFQVTFTLNWAMILDTITSGIESWSHQWAYIDVGPHEPGYVNYFTATFEDHDDGHKRRGEGKKYKLSKAKLLKGLRILQEKYPHHFNDIINESGDAITGDVLIQCALLGDIIYG